MTGKTQWSWSEHPFWGNDAGKNAFISLAHRYLVKPSGQTGARTREMKIADLIRSSYEACGQSGAFEGLKEPAKNEIDQIRDFIVCRSQSMRSHAYLDCVLVYLCNHCQRDEYPYNAILGDIDIWEVANCISESRVEDIEQHLTPGVLADSMPPLLAVCEKYFGVGEEDFQKSARLLTGQPGDKRKDMSNEDRAFFLCYRYSSKPGRIVKSFIAFTPPEKKYPYTRFQNFAPSADYTDKLKRSDGVVFLLGTSGLYCVGRMGEGHAMKFLAIKPPAHFETTSHLDGLVVSIDFQGELVASRILLVRTTDFCSHEDAGIGAFNIDELKDELGKDELRRIRNHITFTQEGPIEDLEDKMEANDADIISTTKRLLTTDVNGKRKLRFQTEDGIPYNPADPAHYPFNQALKIFTDTK